MIMVLVFFPLLVTGQRLKKDSLAPLRDFISVATGYQRIPVYLSMEIRNSTNFVTTEEDTAVTKAEFFLQRENSYIRFGEEEQLVNDSLALLVSNKLQAMILFTNAAPVVKKMKNMLTMTMPDSSVDKMAKRYSCSVSNNGDSIRGLELQSREQLYGTGLPKEIIKLEYLASTRLPVKVMTIKRALLPLDSLQFEQLRNEGVSGNTLFKIDGLYFLMKERTVTFSYTRINRNWEGVVPAIVSDRIGKDLEGEFMPLQAYSGYMLTKGN